MHYRFGLSDYDIDNLPDDPTGRCPGTSEHKCGRFCGKRAYYCPRCEAVLDAIAREELAREAAWQDEKIAREQAAWDAYTDTDEYRQMVVEAEIIQRERDVAAGYRPVEGGLWEPHYCGFAVGPAVSDVELALAIAEAAMDEAREDRDDERAE